MKYRKIGSYYFKDLSLNNKTKALIKHIDYKTWHTLDFSIYNVYKNPSQAKRQAEIDIINQMREIEIETDYQCDRYVILGHNCNYFSCAYRIYNKDYSELLGFVYHTYANAYVIWFD